MNYVPEPKPIPELIAKFMMNDLAGILKKNGFSVDYKDCPIAPQHLRMMLELMNDGHLERKDVRLWCVEMCKKANEIKAELSDLYDCLNQKIADKRVQA
jgi:Asp-tRNA(Asn)/Glu-tRNA(Gln) amidotransferase B subunit